MRTMTGVRCSMLVALAACCGVIASPSFAQTAVPEPPALMWLDSAGTAPDTHVAFRGRFELATAGEVEVHACGASWYTIWLDGRFLVDGPNRFDPAHPEYQLRRVRLEAGAHVLAVHLTHTGVSTRILADMPPFLYCTVHADGQKVPVDWRCTKLAGYQPQVRRINPQLGWIDWCDTRANPADWQQPGFNDAEWSRPDPAATRLGELRPTSIGHISAFALELLTADSGTFSDTFGYDTDDPPARFFLRDLAPSEHPVQGVWRRYDVGRVRLGRPRFTIEAPAGTVIEFGYGEQLTGGRVNPWITLSAGQSCNMDRYIARGGRQEFFPTTPKGMRYIEVHVHAPAAHVKFVRQEFVERTYFGHGQGSFSCSDRFFDNIWRVGVETFRACTEDAITDNPTRERGQWTGDVVSVGMDINAVVYNDLRLVRRGLQQSAWSARDDGLVAGMSPGGSIYLSTYAAQWVDACVHYYELTGDRALLEELFSAAVRNLAALEKHLTPDGLSDEAGWAFIDWGYVRNEGPSDMGLNLHYLSALEAMVRWCRFLDKPTDAERYAALAERVRGIIRAYLEPILAESAFEALGYQRTTLALRAGLIPREQEATAVAFMKAHILSCFPNHPHAPRLSHPGAANEQLITPYFAHYAFPELIKRGEMEFVLNQYRTCWGWMMERSRTWLEVFDTRWSHCHQWSGAPTWQLSRYVLGLHPRFDLGERHYVLDLQPGSLTSAVGRVPVPNGRSIELTWKREGDQIQYRIIADPPIWLHHSPTEPGREIRGDQRFTIPAPASAPANPTP